MRPMTTLPFLTLLAGCSPAINRITTKRVIPAMMAIPDLEIACSFGNTVVGGVASVKPKAPAEQAMLLAHVASGICAELDAREHKLDALVALHTIPGPERAAAAADHRIQSQRAYATAARRYNTAWLYTLDTFGLDCPRLKPREESLYLAGMIAGVLGLISDAAAGQPYNLPQNILLEAGRGASCLDDDIWWGVPGALQAAAWATVPGSAPEGTDPWAILESAAAKGDAAGVSVARALQVFTAANAGDDDLLHAAIVAHGAAPVAERAPEWVLLDEYARSLTLFESDQIWLRAAGRRTESLGTLPGRSNVDSPFGESPDPFGEDPFGTPEPSNDDEETP
ncbi:MAG: hypothetical protein ACI8S6_004248 [Myxococcota bacterium]|jgi:hypothetical protein